MADVVETITDAFKYPTTDIGKLLKYGIMVTIIAFFGLIIFTTLLVTLGAIGSIPFVPAGVDVSSLIPTDILALIGALGIFSIIGVIVSIIVSFFMGGYQYRVFKQAVAGSSELPGYEGVGNLFVTGIKYFIVGVVYAIIPAIINSIGGSIGGLSGAIIRIIGLIAGIIFTVLCYVAIAKMAKEDSFAAAFDFKAIFGKISEINWLAFIIVGIILGLIIIIVTLVAIVLAGFITAILAGLNGILGTIVGLILFLLITLLLLPYLTLVSTRAYAVLAAAEL